LIAGSGERQRSEFPASPCGAALFLRQPADDHSEDAIANDLGGFGARQPLYPALALLQPIGGPSLHLHDEHLHFANNDLPALEPLPVGKRAQGAAVPMTPASSSASRAADWCGDLRLAGHPFGMIHRPVSREVTSKTSVRELGLCRYGSAAY
jgi:hypothetical protein